MKSNDKNQNMDNGKNTNPENQNSHKRNEGNNGSNRNIWVVSAILIVLILISVGAYYMYQKNNEYVEAVSQMEQQEMEMKERLGERDSLINEWVSAFNQIEKDIDLIREKEQLLEVKSDDLEFTEDKKSEILNDIKFINSLLESNKKKINNLNTRLRNSGMKVAGLENKIKDLENSISVRDSSINVLKTILVEKDFQLAGLNERLDQMEMEVSQQSAIIDMQTNEMQKAYLAYGTYKELKDKGVLTKDGGFLWIGQEKTLKEDFSENSFNEIDILETKTIPVNSKEAELITNHPKESYELVKDSAEMIAYLEIKNPYEFWKVSKYAVLETKK